MNTELLSKVCDASQVNAIGRTFDLMEIAEREIKLAEYRTRGKTRVRIHNVFGYACPFGLGQYADDVYRAHVRELIDRARKSERPDFSLATEAECMVALSEASLKAPLSQQYQAVYEMLFVRIMGKKEFVGQKVTPEWYVGSNAEVLDQLRRKFARERK